MEKDMTVDYLAELIARTMASKEGLSRLEIKVDQTQDLVKNMFDLVKNIDENIADIKQSKVSVLEHIQLEQRVDTLEEKVEKYFPKKKLNYGNQ